jgi:hypothetical protein
MGMPEISSIPNGATKSQISINTVTHLPGIYIEELWMMVFLWEPKYCLDYMFMFAKIDNPIIK